MKVAVIGCGYVGLITGVGLALMGHQVTAIDIDQSRVERIGQGVVPFHEPGVAEGLKDCLKKGNLEVFSSIEQVADCDIILICVQTPPKTDGAINLQVLEAAASDLALVFARNPRNRTIVVRSTVVPGTTDKIVAPIFKQSGSIYKTEVAVNPEFLREGSAMEDFLSPDRIVVGTHSLKARRMLVKLYEPFNIPIIWTKPSTAELSKYASNALLATLVSFSNEIARVCERTPGADVEDVLGIVHRDRRFNSKMGNNSRKSPAILSYLKAGCGFGGSCLPKDLSALISYAHSVDQNVSLFESVAKINANQPLRVVEMVQEALGKLKKSHVTVLGAAFKGGTDDLRESPGLKIADELCTRGVRVCIYDPLVNAAALKAYEYKGIQIASNLKVAVENADVCIVASNAPEFLPLERWKKYFKDKKTIIIDGRRLLKIPVDKDVRYYAVGRAVEGNIATRFK